MKSRILWLEDDKMAMTKEEKAVKKKAYYEANKEKLLEASKKYKKLNGIKWQKTYTSWLSNEDY